MIGLSAYISRNQTPFATEQNLKCRQGIWGIYFGFNMEALMISETSVILPYITLCYELQTGHALALYRRLNAKTS
jgi:hypothetical protein